MIISGGYVLNDDLEFEQKDLFIDESTGLFSDVPAGGEFIDARGEALVPGFIDTHIHGAFGFDISDGNARDIVSMAKLLPKFGVMAFLPTTMTLSEDRIMKVFEAVSKAQEILEAEKASCAKILGVRLEGPMLSSSHAGVQSEKDLIFPDEGKELIRKVEERFPGMLKMIDIAPELEGAFDLIGELSDRYVISLAHSSADYETASEAFRKGATSVTHLLNAMESCTKRSPGIPGAAFDSNAWCEVICDGLHIDPTVLRILGKVIPDERFIIISDSMRGAGMPDGNYLLGDVPVEVKNGRTYYGEFGNLAGSVTNMKDEVINLIRFGVDSRKVLRGATVNPLMRLKGGKDLMMGSLSPGNKAFVNFFRRDMSSFLLCYNYMR